MPPEQTEKGNMEDFLNDSALQAQATLSGRRHLIGDGSGIGDGDIILAPPSGRAAEEVAISLNSFMSSAAESLAQCGEVCAYFFL